MVHAQLDSGEGAIDGATGLRADSSRREWSPLRRSILISRERLSPHRHPLPGPPGIRRAFIGTPDLGLSSITAISGEARCEGRPRSACRFAAGLRTGPAAFTFGIRLSSNQLGNIN